MGRGWGVTSLDWEKARRDTAERLQRKPWMATERQVRFIETLAAERGVRHHARTRMTRKAASDEIERLLALPKPLFDRRR